MPEIRHKDETEHEQDIGVHEDAEKNGNRPLPDSLLRQGLCSRTGRGASVADIEVDHPKNEPVRTERGVPRNPKVHDRTEKKNWQRENSRNEQEREPGKYQQT